jgi:hypothetical protein
MNDEEGTNKAPARPRYGFGWYAECDRCREGYFCSVPAYTRCERYPECELSPYALPPEVDKAKARDARGAAAVVTVKPPTLPEAR